jgi:hypothetical protein
MIQVEFRVLIKDLIVRCLDRFYFGRNFSRFPFTFESVQVIINCKEFEELKKEVLFYMISI